VDAKLRVVVADDERPARLFLLNLLDTLDDVIVVGAAISGDEMLDLIERLRPDVVFLDIVMPGLDGFGVVHLLPEGPGPLVAFVTAFDGYRDLAQEVGAFEYLLKPVTRSRLRSALARARERRSEAWSHVVN
jgi:two-component system, LytTR family, response regulator